MVPIVQPTCRSHVALSYDVEVNRARRGLVPCGCPMCPGVGPGFVIASTGRAFGYGESSIGRIRCPVLR